MEEPTSKNKIVEKSNKIAAKKPKLANAKQNSRYESDFLSNSNFEGYEEGDFLGLLGSLNESDDEKDEENKMEKENEKDEKNVRVVDEENVDEIGEIELENAMLVVVRFPIRNLFLAPEFVNICSTLNALL